MIHSPPTPTVKIDGKTKTFSQQEELWEPKLINLYKTLNAYELVKPYETVINTVSINMEQATMDNITQHDFSHIVHLMKRRFEEYQEMKRIHQRKKSRIMEIVLFGVGCLLNSISEVLILSSVLFGWNWKWNICCALGIFLWFLVWLFAYVTEVSLSRSAAFPVNIIFDFQVSDYYRYSDEFYSYLYNSASPIRIGFNIMNLEDQRKMEFRNRLNIENIDKFQFHFLWVSSAFAIAMITRLIQGSTLWISGFDVYGAVFCSICCLISWLLLGLGNRQEMRSTPIFVKLIVCILYLCSIFGSMFIGLFMGGHLDWNIGVVTFPFFVVIGLVSIMSFSWMIKLHRRYLSNIAHLQRTRQPTDEFWKSPMGSSIVRLFSFLYYIKMVLIGIFVVFSELSLLDLVDVEWHLPVIPLYLFNIATSVLVLLTLAFFIHRFYSERKFTL